MFNGLLDAARNSPFKTPFTRAQCEASDKSLVKGRTIAAASGSEVEFASLHYYLLCGVGGILSCGKCNMEF